MKAIANEPDRLSGAPEPTQWKQRTDFFNLSLASISVPLITKQISKTTIKMIPHG